MLFPQGKKVILPLLHKAEPQEYIFLKFEIFQTESVTETGGWEKNAAYLSGSNHVGNFFLIPDIHAKLATIP